jgi:hypothetical protein
MSATPGPWEVGGTFHPGTPQERRWIWGAAPAGCRSGKIVAQFVRTKDAHLVAAAPELLEALEAALDETGRHASDCPAGDKGIFVEEPDPDCDCRRARARAAIAKATRGER